MVSAVGNGEGCQRYTVVKALGITGCVLGVLGGASAFTALRLGKINQRFALIAGGSSGLITLASAVALLANRPPKGPDLATVERLSFADIKDERSWTGEELAAHLGQMPKLRELDLSGTEGLDRAPLMKAIGEHRGLDVVSWGSELPELSLVNGWESAIEQIAKGEKDSVPWEARRYLCCMAEFDPRWIGERVDSSDRVLRVIKEMPALRKCEIAGCEVRSIKDIDDCLLVGELSQRTQIRAISLPEGLVDVVQELALAGNPLSEVDRLLLRGAEELDCELIGSAEALEGVLRASPNLVRVNLGRLEGKQITEGVVEALESLENLCEVCLPRKLVRGAIKQHREGEDLSTVQRFALGRRKAISLRGNFSREGFARLLDSAPQLEWIAVSKFEVLTDEIIEECRNRKMGLVLTLKGEEVSDANMQRLVGLNVRRILLENSDTLQLGGLEMLVNEVRPHQIVFSDSCETLVQTNKALTLLQSSYSIGVVSKDGKVETSWAWLKRTDLVNVMQELTRGSTEGIYPMLQRVEGPSLPQPVTYIDELSAEEVQQTLKSTRGSVSLTGVPKGWVSEDLAREINGRSDLDEVRLSAELVTEALEAIKSKTQLTEVQKLALSHRRSIVFQGQEFDDDSFAQLLKQAPRLKEISWPDSTDVSDAFVAACVDCGIRVSFGLDLAKCSLERIRRLADLEIGQIYLTNADEERAEELTAVYGMGTYCFGGNQESSSEEDDEEGLTLESLRVLVEQVQPTEIVFRGTCKVVRDRAEAQVLLEENYGVALDGVRFPTSWEQMSEDPSRLTQPLSAKELRLKLVKRS